jgi:hyaluronoglucosaminidase
VQLGPVIGREIAAVKATRGWVANGMPLPHASEIAFATIADLAWNPDAYDPEISWARTMPRIAGPHADTLRRFAENARASLLDPCPIEPLGVLGEAWLAAFPADSPDLAKELGALRDLSEAIQGLGVIGEELAPWSRALSGYGGAGLSAMDLAADMRRGQPIDPAALDALKAAAAELANGDARIANGAGDRLLSGAIDRLSGR